jgi:HEPN domain
LAPDPEINDDPVGFHAQQAVEKALKVALTLHGVDFPKTHDLDFLVGLCNRNEIELPTEMTQVGWLTPWAAEFGTTTRRWNLSIGTGLALSPSSPPNGAASLFQRAILSHYAWHLPR